MLKVNIKDNDVTEVVLVSSLLPLNYSTPFPSFFIVGSKQAMFAWKTALDSVGSL